MCVRFAQGANLNYMEVCVCEKKKSFKKLISKGEIGGWKYYVFNCFCTKCEKLSGQILEAYER